MKIYLACPYSHPDPSVCEERFQMANMTAARLMEKGDVVFSPISHSHPIAKYIGNHLDLNFWLKQDRAFVEWCDTVYVLCIPGWEESQGVDREVRWAREMGKEVFLYSPMAKVGEAEG